ncbi:MAG: pyridoxamine 5'-phosphate oxidase family protein [Acidimicrobiales bacterium]
MALDEQEYILLTTFRRDRTPVATPVWVVPLEDGRLGFWTSSGSTKAKRLAHTGRVTVQPCDVRGAGSPPAPARPMPPHGWSAEPTTRRSSRRSGPSTASWPRRRSS